MKREEFKGCDSCFQFGQAFNCIKCAAYKTGTKDFDKGQFMKDEKDPHGLDSHTKGAKLDAGKTAVYRGLLDYFPRACMDVAHVSTLGAQKYAWKGWEVVPDGMVRYSDALVRHLLAESIEGAYDNGPKGLGVLHAAQVAWNAFARLELLLRQLEKDNAIH